MNMPRIKTLRFLVVMAVVVFLPGCATAPVTRIPREAILLRDVCVTNNISWSWDDISQVVTLERRGLLARAMVGSEIVVVNNEPVRLRAPLQRRDGVIIVPPDFKAKVIDRLVVLPSERHIPALLPSRFRTIVLDPGHGGKDPGAIGPGGIQEKTVVLDIARRLKNELEKSGLTVFMTREDDTFVPLEKRAEFAHNKKADLFISIHANANHSRRIEGFEVYYLREDDARIQQEEHRLKPGAGIFQPFQMKRDCPVVRHILLDLMYSHKQAASQRFAQYLSDEVSRDIHATSRGIYEAGFVVLKQTVIPAVLVEVGYLSHPAEERKLDTSDYRRQIAESLAKNIIRYVRQ